MKISNSKTIDVMKMLGIAAFLYASVFLVQTFVVRQFPLEWGDSLVDTILYLPILVFGTLRVPMYSTSTRKGIYIFVSILLGLLILFMQWALHLNGILPFPQKTWQSGLIIFSELSINMICAATIYSRLPVKVTQLP